MDNEKKSMIEALERSLGIVTAACKMVRMSRQTHYNWLESDTEYKNAVADIAEMTIDFAESQLHKQIQDGEVSSTIFFLKCKGKKRGYIERSETDLLSGGEKLSIFVAPSAEIAEQINRRMAELHAINKGLSSDAESISGKSTDNTQGGNRQ